MTSFANYEFAKYQALGNDYLVIDPSRINLPASAEIARLLCDRHLGIGADGVLFGPTGPVRVDRPIDLTIRNPDGSGCGRSGNGIRIFALYLAAHYLAGDEFTVRTAAGESPVRLLDRAAGLVRVGLGRPSFDAAGIPLLGATGPAIAAPLVVDGQPLTVTCVNNGNPHTVVATGELSAELARALGPRIAGHPRLPSRSNVQFMQVLDRRTVRIEIWERGAGYTLASGSSACAAASAAHALGLVDAAVEVRMPGGTVQVATGPDGAVSLTGTAEPVLVGRFAPAFRQRLDRALPVGAA
ncbi:MAG: diaminopimelate epimerase [Mycobacteriales bacterium]|jgi:diaminopimelate epimerase